MLPEQPAPQTISDEAQRAFKQDYAETKLLLMEANARIAKLTRHIAKLEAPKALTPIVGLPGRGKGQKPSEQTNDAPAAPTA